MELTPRRRRVLSTILAVVLAAESVSAVAAAGLTVRSGHSGVAPAAQEPAITTNAGDLIRAASIARAAGVAGARPAPTPDSGWTLEGSRARKAARATASAEPPPASASGGAGGRDDKAREVTGEARTKAPKTKSGTTTKARSTTVRSGRNHVWIPSLGINRSVAWFPCDRKRPPDSYVYRWGCAGSNNVYLLGHAYSVFKPLHDAYVRGRLHTGMKAYYADARGRLHTYRVRWWKVTAPTTAASWAWAALRQPSMTLQTCVGRNSAYRLMVRLVEVG